MGVAVAVAAGVATVGVGVAVAVAAGVATVGVDVAVAVAAGVGLAVCVAPADGVDAAKYRRVGTDDTAVPPPLQVTVAVPAELPAVRVIPVCWTPAFHVVSLVHSCAPESVVPATVRLPLLPTVTTDVSELVHMMVSVADRLALIFGYRVALDPVVMMVGAAEDVDAAVVPAASV